MDAFLRYQRQLAAFISLFAALGFVALLLLVPDGRDLAWGWLGGSIAGLLVFRSRVAHIVNLSRLPREAWAKASLKNSLTTYALMATGLGLAAWVPALNAYAACGGILLERVVLVGDGWLRPQALSPDSLAQPLPPGDDTCP